MNKTAFVSTLVAGAAVAAGITLAVPAQADPGTVADDNFLAALKSAGITYPNPHQAVVTGQAVCGLMTSPAAGSRRLLLTPLEREGPVRPVGCCVRPSRLLGRDASIAGRRTPFG